MDENMTKKVRRSESKQGPETGRKHKALVYDLDAIDDASDAVQLARKDGKAALGCEKVRVLPETAEINNDLIVEVEKKR